MSSIIDDFHAIQHRLNELEQAKASTAKLEQQTQSVRNIPISSTWIIGMTWNSPDSSGTYH